MQWQKHLPLLSPTTQIRHCPLFWHDCAYGIRATAAVKQTSGQLIASAERQVTIIPLTIGPIVGQSLVSIFGSLGSREIPFPGSRKKIETRDSGGLSTFLVSDFGLKLKFETLVSSKDKVTHCLLPAPHDKDLTTLSSLKYPLAQKHVNHE